MYRERHIFCGSIQLGANRPSQFPGTEVRGKRLKATLREHEGAALFRRLFVLLDHLMDPSSLTCNVNIMSSRLGACFERMFAIQTVWANRSKKDASLPCEDCEIFVTEIGNLDC